MKSVATVIVCETSATVHRRGDRSTFTMEAGCWESNETFSFAKFRNWAHSLEYEWIFWIDTDEGINKALRERIYSLAENAPPEVGGFLFLQAGLDRHPCLYGGEPIFACNQQVRLYRNKPEFYWEGHAHEQIRHTIYEAGYSIEKANVVISHYGYDVPDDVLIAKLKRNIDLMARWLDENDSSHVLFDFYLERYERDVEACRRAMDYQCAKAAISHQLRYEHKRSEDAQRTS